MCVCVLILSSTIITSTLNPKPFQAESPPLCSEILLSKRHGHVKRKHTRSCRRRRRRTDGEDGTDKESAAVKKDKESEEVRKQQPEKAEGIEAEEEEA